MAPRITLVLVGVVSLCISLHVRAQQTDSVMGRLANFPARLFSRIQAKAARLDQQLTSQTQKYVKRMTNQEARLNKRLSATDSNAAAQLFAGSTERYAALMQRLRQDTGSRQMLVSGAYQPYTDSLRGTLAFLQQHPQLVSGSGVVTPALPGSSTVAGLSTVSAQTGKLQKAASQLQSLQAKMQDAALLQQFMQQRQAQIQQYLSKYTQLPAGISNAFSGYQAQAAYYKQQVSQYEQTLNDPDKMFQTALTLLNRVPAFSSFMQRNSALSSLFPGAGSGPTSDPSKPGQGLPGRDQVLAGLQDQLGKNGLSAEAVAQKSTSSAVDAAGGAGGGLPDKLNGIGNFLSGGGASGLNGGGSIGNGGTGGSTTMGNSQLNPQKTKSFLHRFEFGFNIQNMPSTYFYPTTTDIGVSLGYKLNGQNRIGIGASYKVGWSGDIHHLQVSGQGASVRSFLDIGISKTWLASGGLEMNYQPLVYTVHMLRDLENWEPAGLIGVTKVIPIKSKLIKNTRLQFLWNFLSYYQVPATQPFIFRLGYSF
jgi:hypothetical protein